MNRARAVRYDNGDMEKEIAEFDISGSHQVYSGKNGYRSQAVSFAGGYGNRVKTENGGLGHRTTGHELLDLHFQVSSLRRQNVRYIEDNFVKAYYENRRYAVKRLFYLRDIAQGLGERRSFRICMGYLAQSHPKIAREVMELIPRYGRYDDLRNAGYGQEGVSQDSVGSSRLSECDGSKDVSQAVGAGRLPAVRIFPECHTGGGPPENTGFL